MSPIVTIGITSYNRVNELKRCLESVSTRFVEDIEILVSEDKSPQSAKIEEMVRNFASDSRYSVRFSSNEKNLGYDMNLGSIIKKAKGEYIYFMSDDDMLNSGFLDILIPFLKNGTNAGVLYAPFIHSDSDRRDRNRGQQDLSITAGEEGAAKYIYDSILFSGLIFKKAYVENYDASEFKNMNYFQVYLFLEMLFRYGGYYFATPSVMCVGDGENAYGISESSGGDQALANRKSVKSNLAFNKTLIKVIRKFDNDEGTHVIDAFAKQYSLHAYSGMSIARDEGKQYYKEYWGILNSLDIKLYPITKVYYILLLLLGRKRCDALLKGAKKRIKG